MQADAAALPFMDGSFDVVVSRFAVHHFEDPAVQIGEMRRVLRPGGRLAVADLISDPDPHDRRAPEPSRTPARPLAHADPAARRAGRAGGGNRRRVPRRRALARAVARADAHVRSGSRIRSARRCRPTSRAARRPASARATSAATRASCTRWPRSSLQERPYPRSELLALVGLAHEIVAVGHHAQTAQRLLGDAHRHGRMPGQTDRTARRPAPRRRPRPRVARPSMSPAVKIACLTPRLADQRRRAARSWPSTGSCRPCARSASRTARPACRSADRRPRRAPVRCPSRPRRPSAIVGLRTASSRPTTRSMSAS